MEAKNDVARALPARRVVGTAAALVALLACGGAEAQLAPGEAADGLELTDWVAGVNNATDIAFLSNGRAVIVRKTGEISVAGLDGTMIKADAARMTVDATSEKGLLGVVIDAQDNIYLYASTGDDPLNKHKVYKARAAADGTVTVDLNNPIVSMGLEGPANHDGGGMVLHKGQLYIGVGDTGANATPPQNRYGSCLNKANGKVLRVNLDGSIPADNPLNALAMVTGCESVVTPYGMFPPDKRIYAWGFRNPWRLWIDPVTDLMWVGDVGETTEEEITVGGKGTHHGYPFVEGSVKYAAVGGLADCMAMTPSGPCLAPTDSYPHRESPGAPRRDSSVTGGLVPVKGCGWGAFENRYIFGDYNRNILWTLDVKPDHSGAVPGSRKDLATNVSSPVTFRQGPDGAIYIASNNEGSIKRLVPKNRPAACSAAQGPVDGGAGGASGAGGAAGTGQGGAGGASRDGAADVPAGAGDSDDGCGCHLGGPPRDLSAGLMALVLALAGVLFRVRRRGR